MQDGRRASIRAPAAPVFAALRGRRWCPSGCRARAARSALPLPGRSQTRPSSRPMPWIFVTGPTTHCSRICASRWRTLSSSPSVSMACIVATIAAAASGPPPKVVPRSPGPKLRRDFLRAQHGSARDTRAQRLGAGENVGLDAVHLHGEELSAATHAGLHFVGNQDRAECLRLSCAAFAGNRSDRS